MSKVICEREDLVAIADAVRAKTGSTDEMTLSGIVSGIEGIETGSTEVEIKSGNCVFENLGLNDPSTNIWRITLDNSEIDLNKVTFRKMSYMVDNGEAKASYIVYNGERFTNTGSMQGETQISNNSFRIIVPTSINISNIVSVLYEIW